MATLIDIVGGVFKRKTAITTTAGAGDADKIPATNASGVLDPSLLNATVSSAGAGDAGKLPQLDAAGRLDVTTLPVGVGADVNVVLASEALAAGDLVNIWNDAGTAKVRKADGSTTGKYAMGYVKAAVSSGASATVYADGTNDGLTGITPGPLWLSATVPGGVTSTPPSGGGQTVQLVGWGVSSTAYDFQAGPVTEL